MRRLVGFNRFIPSAEDEDAEVNLTPMLDVVFIMLIFFIVTATFIREQGLAVNPPNENEQVQPTPSKKLILVNISSRDRITISQQDVDVRSVRAVLSRLHAQNPDAAVVVQSHAKARTHATVYVMDMARLVGIGNVSLAAR